MRSLCIPRSGSSWWSRFEIAAALCLLAILSACAVPVDYAASLDPSDACAKERNPIVSAGNTVEQRNYERAKQIAQQRMVREGRLLSTNPNQRDGVVGALLASLHNSMEKDRLLQEEYTRIRANPTGEEAVQMLAMIQGEANDTRGQLQSVSRATSALRECRSQTIASIQSRGQAGALSPSETSRALRTQQNALAQDDDLINKVFGGFNQMAALYESNQKGGRAVILKEATALRSAPNYQAGTLTTINRGTRVRTVGTASESTAGWQMVDAGGRVGFLPASVLAAPPTANPLEQLVREQASAQSVDRKASDDMRRTLEDAIGSKT